MLILVCGTDRTSVPINIEPPRAFYNLTSCYLNHRHFCELGGLYKLWKQVNADIVGLEHYRRFFVESPSKLLGERRISDILATHDVIMSPNVIGQSNVLAWIAQEKHNPKASSETIVKDTILRWFMFLRDKYSTELIDYMLGRMLADRSYYGCNMFVGNKRAIDDYALFLFPMLEKFTIEVMRGKIEPRIYGYLSEYLIGYWMEWREYDVYSNPKETYPPM